MNPNSAAIDHFSAAAKLYDERNKKLAPILDNIHFLLRLILKDLPARARILCVGVGTGAEILSLADTHPEWTFLGIDPSEGMLAVCRERLSAAGILNRCELLCGYVHEAPPEGTFDAALSILVGHFVKHDEKLNFYKTMCDRLCVNGILVNAEISIDFESEIFPALLKNWEAVQSLMGAPPESIANLNQVLREMLSILSPVKTEALLRQCGIQIPIHFFQAFAINAWYGFKKS